MDDHLSSGKGDEEDDHHSLETSGLDDIDSWISLLNADEAEEFTHDLDAFFSDDILDSDLDINFEKPIHEIESEEKQGGQREIFAPSSLPAYGYGPNYLTGLSNPMASKRSCPIESEEKQGGQREIFAPSSLPAYGYGPNYLTGLSNPMASKRSCPIESEEKQGGQREIFAPSSLPGYGYGPNYLTGLSNPMASKRSCPIESEEKQGGQREIFAPSSSPTYGYGPNYLTGLSNPMASKRSCPIESEEKQGGQREIFAPSSLPAYGYGPNYLTGLSNPMASKRSCPWMDYVVNTPPSPPAPFLMETSPIEIPWKRGTGKSKDINHLMEALEYYKAENDKEKQSDEDVPSPENHPLLMSQCEPFAVRNVINILKSISILKLEQMLLDLDFECAVQLLDIMCYLVKKKSEMELLESCSPILIKTHLQPLLAEKTYHYIFLELKDVLFKQKVPLVHTDSSSSETSLIKGTPLRYRGWKWIDSKEQNNKSSKTEEVDVNTYFPVLSSTSTLGDETHVTEHHDAKEEPIVCCSCFYEKKHEDGMNFIMVQCGHLYCKPCTNFIFSPRNPVKPHQCFICEVIIKRMHNRNLF